MHRSGTSLVARWLHSCGLNLGDKLLKADFTNPHGHFEDQDFLDLHEQILFDNEENYFTTSSSFRWTQEHIKTAQKIINAKNQGPHLWGWKEPRTTLFIKEWKALLPELTLIFIIRHPFQVVHSLLKREKVILSRWKYFLLNKKKYKKDALKVWMNYNSLILEHCKKNEEDFLLFDLKNIVENSTSVINTINKHFETNLKVNSIDALIDKHLLKSDLPDINSAVSKKALDLYAELLTYQKEL